MTTKLGFGILFEVQSLYSSGDANQERPLETWTDGNTKTISCSHLQVNPSVTASELRRKQIRKQTRFRVIHKREDTTLSRTTERVRNVCNDKKYTRKVSEGVRNGHMLVYPLWGQTCTTR